MGAVPAPVTYQLTSSNSTHTYSPSLVRALIEDNNAGIIPRADIRIWEFLNYYGPRPAEPEGDAALSAQMQLRPYDIEEGLYALQVGLRGREVEAPDRRPVSLTFLALPDGASDDWIGLAKEACETIASGLKAGDRVSFVVGNGNESYVLVDSHEISGPDDDLFLSTVVEGGWWSVPLTFTEGFAEAYALAAANHIAGGANRVVLLAGGDLAPLPWAEGIVADAAESSSAPVQLIGVGFGAHPGEDNRFVPDLARSGGGASVLIDTEQEVERIFDREFTSLIEDAARDVSVLLTLPPHFTVEDYFGEELSQSEDPSSVGDLAAGDNLVFQQLIRTDAPDSVLANDEVSITVRYVDPRTGEEDELALATNMQDLVDGPCQDMRKGDAIVVYAQTLGLIDDLIESEGAAAATQACQAGLETVTASAAELADENLQVIAQLLGDYCVKLEDFNSSLMELGCAPSSETQSHTSSTGGFVAVSSGDSFTCGLREDGSVECWGMDQDGQSTPPNGALLVTISSGEDHTCGLREDGSAVCWGNDSAGQSSPPEEETLVAITSGRRHTCGLREDGTPVCWGEDHNGVSDPPSGETLTEISAGTDLTCGLRQDGTAVCWGEDYFGESSPPQDVSFVSVGAGMMFACGLREDGTVECWGGTEDNPGASPPPEESFEEIAVGTWHACGLREDGIPRCWGFNSKGEASSPADAYIESISVSESHSCGVTPAGEIACWGASEPLPDFGGIAAIGSGANPCAVRDDGTVFCHDLCQPVFWQEDTFTAIASGDWYACAIRADGTVECWGGDDCGETHPPDGETFTEVAAGYNFACGLHPDGGVSCWGADPDAPVHSPSGGSFTDITAGYGHACGVLEDGTIECWGEVHDSLCDIPDGNDFTAVSSGEEHVCGLHADGVAECWGQSYCGQTDPPAGETFIKLAAGGEYSCGLREDGSLSCWGEEGMISDAPIGEIFADVSAGGEHACGLREDGTMTCWGLYSF